MNTATSFAALARPRHLAPIPLKHESLEGFRTQDRAKPTVHSGLANPRTCAKVYYLVKMTSRVAEQ